MPARKRQIESPIAKPIAIPKWKQAQDEEEKEDAEKVTKTSPEPKRIQTEEEKADMKKREAALFLEEEDKIKARQQQVNRLISEEVGHFEYETPEMHMGQTWEDALRSTIRTYDAAQMEIERHYRLIGYTKTKSQWPLDKLDVLREKKAIPTRSNQELLLEIALQHEHGPPTAKTREMMENWATERTSEIAFQFIWVVFFYLKPHATGRTTSRKVLTIKAPQNPQCSSSVSMSIVKGSPSGLWEALHRTRESSQR
jgi:hypothetical protein